MDFNYNLTYDEIYEAFYLLNKKRWGKVLVVLLTLAAVVLLIAYYNDGRKIYSFFLLLMDLALLYYLIYVPVLKSKKGAMKVSRQSGTYKVRLTWEGKVVLGTDAINLAGDKDARAIETETIFVIRPDNMHTICLPKRIMTPDEREEVRKLLNKYIKYENTIK